MSKDSVILERRFVPEGTLVMKQGDQGNCSYLIQSGSVQVFMEKDGRRVILTKLELGQIFGEMALIFDEPRTASVIALEDTNLIAITRQNFERKLNNTDPTIRAIVTMLTQRIITANNSLTKSASSIDELIDTTQLVFQNVLMSMPEMQRGPFEDKVLPKLGDFLDAVRAYQPRKKPETDEEEEKES